MSTKLVFESSSFQKQYMLNIKNFVSCLLLGKPQSYAIMAKRTTLTVDSESITRSSNIYLSVL